MLIMHICSHRRITSYNVCYTKLLREDYGNTTQRRRYVHWTGICWIDCRQSCCEAMMTEETALMYASPGNVLPGMQGTFCSSLLPTSCAQQGSRLLDAGHTVRVCLPSRRMPSQGSGASPGRRSATWYNAVSVITSYSIHYTKLYESRGD